MTWQRIDESTHIDETLVTCAEYQLFIDEMREQGQYYQPDHWNSYQFPKGQAREPIVGLRYFDAWEFCKWMSDHENGGWHYRIPTSKEAIQFHLKIVSQKPLGYWVASIYKTIEKPERSLLKLWNLLLHPLYPDMDEAETRQAFYKKSGRQFTWIKEISYDKRIFGKGFHQILNLKGNKYFKIRSCADLALDLAINRPIDIDYLLRYSPYAHYFDRETSSPKARVEQIRDAIVHIREDVVSVAIGHTRGLSADLARDVTLVRAFDEFDNKLIIEDIDPLIDVYILQERIAGRSPAFEGIRLVKERIR